MTIAIITITITIANTKTNFSAAKIDIFPFNNQASTIQNLA